MKGGEYGGHIDGGDRGDHADRECAANFAGGGGSVAGRALGRFEADTCCGEECLARRRDVDPPVRSGEERDSEFAL